MALSISSPELVDGQEIPRRFTADGKDLAPPLAWNDVPAGTKSLALVVDDPDAPDPAAPRATWVHWVVYNLAPEEFGLSEGGGPPPGAIEGKNDWGRTGYGGPNPPTGRHRYFFKLYALDRQLADLGACTKAELEAAMSGHVIEDAQLVVTYEKASGARRQRAA